jgi:hypothetical protein
MSHSAPDKPFVSGSSTFRWTPCTSDRRSVWFQGMRKCWHGSIACYAWQNHNALQQRSQQPPCSCEDLKSLSTNGTPYNWICCVPIHTFEQHSDGWGRGNEYGNIRCSWSPSSPHRAPCDTLLQGSDNDVFASRLPRNIPDTGHRRILTKVWEEMDHRMDVRCVALWVHTERLDLAGNFDGSLCMSRKLKF